MKNVFTFLVSLWLGHTLALCGVITVPGNDVTQQRRADTCGDASLAVTYFEAFGPVYQAHGINTRARFVNSDARGGGPWLLNVAAFHAWTSPGQPNTVPFYVFYNPTTKDFVYLISTDGNPPTAPSGFGAGTIVAYVYSTLICGSFPLYAASLPSVGDHWYTTDLVEHNTLLKVYGWIDAGITAYVLPA